MDDMTFALLLLAIVAAGLIGFGLSQWLLYAHRSRGLWSDLMYRIGQLERDIGDIRRMTRDLHLRYGED